MRKIFITLLIVGQVFTWSSDAFAQKKEVPFMMVGDKAYYPSDFYNMYFESLLSGGETDVTKFATEYAGFCAEIAEARAMGIDTTAAFRQQIDIYTQQYTAPYFSDGKAIEKLAREAAERADEDVKVAHIVIPISQYAFEKDSIAARTRIDSIYTALKGGADWDEMAKKINDSQDGGLIGYANVFQLPYEIETAAYNTPVGEISAPVRSHLGYHIVKVLEKRPERGLVELSHIMIFRKESKEENDAALNSMREALKALRNGESFSQVAQQYSEDNNSVPNGGYIGFFGIGELIPEIEDIVYALPEGGYTSILATPEGWNIIRLISKVSNASYDERADWLSNKVLNDARYLPYQRAYAHQIRSKYFYELNEETLEKCTNTLSNMGYLNGEWRADIIRDGGNQLFTLDTKTFYADDFYGTLMMSIDNYGQNAELRQIVREKVDDFSAGVAMQLYVSSLPSTDPKVSAAVNSYTEKALVYNLINIVGKDSLSTVPLDTLYSIYEKTPDGFMWGERARFDVVSTSDMNVASRVHSIMKSGKSMYEALAAVNKGLVSSAEGKEIFNETKASFKEDFEVKLGVADIIEEEGLYFIFNIKEIIPPTRKTYDEAYQDILNVYTERCIKELPNILCKKYNVQIFAKELKNIEKGLSAQKKARGIK